MNPKKKRTAESCGTVDIMEMENNEPEYSSRDRILISLLPNVCTTQPDRGNAQRAPSGSAKSTAPNSASLKLNISFTVGIRDAQLEKINPHTTKYMEIAKREYDFGVDKCGRS